MNKNKVVKQWLEFANQDLKDAEILFDQKSYRGCSWHCHQAIEKILKAIIIKKGKRPKKIHDLIDLSKETEIKLPENLQDFLEELNLHYLPSRYPDLYKQMRKIYLPKNIQRVLKLTKTLFIWLRNYLNRT
ncbi:MAG: HEPN domain-containing protein [Candidatus Paceibacterales bacterium]